MKGINVNDRPFKYFEFATKIAGLMRTDRSEETRTFKTTPKGWARLAFRGLEVAHKFRRVPSLPEQLCVAIDADMIPAKVRLGVKRIQNDSYKLLFRTIFDRTFDISQVRTPKPKRSTMARRAPATKVSKKSTAAEVDEDQLVRNMVASLHKDFLREFKNNQQNPVNFYEFVCDPTSFANTVENIFHVSFLVKNRKVAMVDSKESRQGCNSIDILDLY